MNTPSIYKGSCLCGGVQYEVSEIENRMANCHCQMCRKFHGAAFSTFGEARSENFRFVQGADLLKVFEAPNGTKRTFCRECGSSILFEPANADGSLVEFSLSTLDTPIPHRPDAHIYTRYKADWYEVTDGRPTYAEGREES